MTPRVLQRIICRNHGTVMAQVIQSPEGVLCEGLGPTIATNGVAFLRAQGFEGPRLPDTREGVPPRLTASQPG